MELYSSSTRIACLIVSCILYLTGVTGNVLIIWTIWKLKSLRSVHNILVCLLAVSDLLIIGYILTMNIIVLISNSAPLYQHCRVHAIVNSFLLISSVALIMLISVSRYVKICHSLKFDAIFTVRNLIISVIIIYLMDATFCSSMWFYDELWTFDRPLQSCVFNRYGSSNVSTSLISIVLGVPLLVTIFCYF